MQSNEVCCPNCQTVFSPVTWKLEGMRDTPNGRIVDVSIVTGGWTRAESFMLPLVEWVDGADGFTRATATDLTEEAVNAKVLERVRELAQGYASIRHEGGYESLR